MKKLILLFILIISLTNVLYASFPVTNYNTLELLETNNEIESPLRDTPLGNWALVLAIIWPPLLYLSVIALFEVGTLDALFLLLASVSALIGSIIMGIRSLNRVEKPQWKAYIALAIATLSLLLIGSNLTPGGFFA